MQDENFDEFTSIMAGFAENAGCTISTVGYRSRFDALKSELTMEEFKESVRVLTRTWKYNRVPTTGVFIDEAKGNRGDLRKCNAILAWESLTYRLRTSGADACRRKKLAFADPAINFAVKMLGGWGVLKNWKVSELPFREKDFKERYLAAMANPSIMIEHKPVDDPRARKLIAGIGN